MTLELLLIDVDASGAETVVSKIRGEVRKRNEITVTKGWVLQLFKSRHTSSALLVGTAVPLRVHVHSLSCRIPPQWPE